MSQSNPVIIQFESEDFYRATLSQILFTVGLDLTAVAHNKSEAEKLLGKVMKGEIKPTLAVIDTMIENNHTEGGLIATKLRELVPDIKIIAYTILDDTEWGDYLAIKSNRIPGQTLTKGLAEFIGVNFDENADAHKFNSD